MSLSRSPSPHPGGGWASPGLTPGSGSSTPRTNVFSPRTLGPSGISWAAAKAKSDRVKGYPSFSTRNNGFFSRQKRIVSSSLPRFRSEHAGRGAGGRWPSGAGRGVRTFLGSMLRRRRLRLLVAVVVGWIWYLFFWAGECFSMGSGCGVSNGWCCSYGGGVSSVAAGWWSQVCGHSGVQCGGGSDGVEGRGRVGDRA